MMAPAPVHCQSDRNCLKVNTGAQTGSALCQGKIDYQLMEGFSVGSLSTSLFHTFPKYNYSPKSSFIHSNGVWKSLDSLSSQIKVSAPPSLEGVCLVSG